MKAIPFLLILLTALVLAAGTAAALAAVDRLEEPFFLLVDDNLTQDRDHALELLHRLAALYTRWVTQASIEVADDDELLRALRDAGCVGLFVGLFRGDTDRTVAALSDLGIATRAADRRNLSRDLDRLRMQYYGLELEKIRARHQNAAALPGS